MIVDLPLESNEDAPPFAGKHCIVVCDGMGSASSKFEIDGKVHSQAYYASRVVMKATSEFLETHYESIMMGFDTGMTDCVKSLQITILKALKTFSDDHNINMETIRVKGAVARVLPTTMASCVFRDTGDHVDVVCFWAGDSRCYSLDANGLHQLSEDDSDSESDAMEDMSMDSPLSNFVSHSTAFHINWRTFSVPKPCMLMVASDGCFAYHKSPMHFEKMFLPGEGHKKFDLESSIVSTLDTLGYDDRTIAIASFGMENYHETMRARGEYVHRMLKSCDIYDEMYASARSERTRLQSMEMTPETRELIAKAKESVVTIREERYEALLAIWMRSFKSGYEACPILFGSSPDKCCKDLASEGIEENSSPRYDEKKDVEETQIETTPEDTASMVEVMPRPHRTVMYEKNPFGHGNKDPIGHIHIIKDMVRVREYAVENGWVNRGCHRESTCVGTNGLTYRLYVRPVMGRPYINGEKDLNTLRKCVELESAGCSIQIPLLFKEGHCMFMVHPCVVECVSYQEARGYPLNVRLRVCLMAAETMRLLHSKGIIHGHIGPDTVILIREADSLRCCVTGWYRTMCFTPLEMSKRGKSGTRNYGEYCKQERAGLGSVILEMLNEFEYNGTLGELIPALYRGEGDDDRIVETLRRILGGT